MPDNHPTEKGFGTGLRRQLQKRQDDAAAEEQPPPQIVAEEVLAETAPPVLPVAEADEPAANPDV